MLKRLGSDVPSILEAADPVSVFKSQLKIESLIFLLYSDRAPMIFQRELQDQIKLSNHESRRLGHIAICCCHKKAQETGTQSSTQMKKVL